MEDSSEPRPLTTYESGFVSISPADGTVRILASSEDRDGLLGQIWTILITKQSTYSEVPPQNRENSVQFELNFGSDCAND